MDKSEKFIKKEMARLFGKTTRTDKFYKFSDSEVGILDQIRAIEENNIKRSDLLGKYIGKLKKEQRPQHRNRMRKLIFTPGAYEKLLEKMEDGWNATDAIIEAAKMMIENEGKR